MARYRYISDHAQSFPSLGLDLEPGQEFEIEEPIDHPDIQPLDQPHVAPKAAEE